MRSQFLHRQMRARNISQKLKNSQELTISCRIIRSKIFCESMASIFSVSERSCEDRPLSRAPTIYTNCDCASRWCQRCVQVNYSSELHSWSSLILLLVGSNRFAISSRSSWYTFLPITPKSSSWDICRSASSMWS